jgi:hypothetical protein
MKRIVLTVLAAAAFLAVTSIAYGQASVPNLVNFQGLLTDTAGNPVSDGTYGVNFLLYDIPAGGVSLWTEATSQTTSGGVFTHQLGSISTLPQSLFQDYDSLFLEIVVNGEIIAPRTLLTSTPYTRLANNLEVRNSANDTVVVRTIPSEQGISTYGSDGLRKIRLWSSTDYGVSYLYDSDGGLTARLSGNSSSGGELNLYQEDGTSGANLLGGSTANGATLSMYSAAGSPTISLDADLTGTGAAVLPSDAISDFEIDDEPGVASDTAYAITSLFLSGAPQNISSRTITVPTSGYVLVIGTCQATVTHTTATLSNAFFGTSDVSVSFPPNQDVFVQIDDGLPSGNYYYAITVHGLYSVNAGANTFYFVADEGTGSWSVADIQFTLAFFPTAYGIVNPTLATGEAATTEEGFSLQSALTAADIAAEQAEAASFNSARLEKEMAEIKAQRAELEARISKLEKEIDRENPAPGVE